MRGFAYGVLGLTALYLAVHAGPAQLATALAVPSQWLAKWVDPAQPLIGAGGLGTASTGPQAAPHPRSGPATPSGGHIIRAP